MEISQIEARQLLELTALWPHSECAPSTQRVAIVRVLAVRVAALMPGWLDEIAANPIRIEDDGTSRCVHFVAGFRYGYNRATREFSAAFLQNNGYWALADIEHDDGRANFDPLIPNPTWNRRIGYALQDKARGVLVDAVVTRVGEKYCEANAAAIGGVAGFIVRQAWHIAGLTQTIKTRFPSKPMRALLAQALAIEPALLALARKCRISVHRHPITNRFLTFVWRHREVLERIERQTPKLLPLVAEYMFTHGAPDTDPTQAAKAWLRAQGVTRQASLLLDTQGVRSLRGFVEAFAGDEQLTALALALRLAQTGHGAQPPSRAAYRVLSQVWRHTSADGIRQRFDKLPQQVLLQCVRRAECAQHPAAVAVARDEIRRVVAWWLRIAAAPPAGAVNGSWQRWLQLVDAAETRKRLALQAISWHSPVTELAHHSGKVRALTNALALYDEGKTMRHCIDNYRDACIKGTFLAFHAEFERDGKPCQATVGLVKREHRFRKWQVSNVCGVANASFGREWPEIAKQLAGLCNVREMVQARREAARRAAMMQVATWACAVLPSFKDWRGKATAITSTQALVDYGKTLWCDIQHYAEECASGQAQAYRVVIENRYAWKTYGLDRYEHFVVLLRKHAAGWAVADVRTTHGMRYQHSPIEPFAQKLAAACNHTDRVNDGITQAAQLRVA